MFLVSRIISLFDSQRQYKLISPKTNISMNMPDDIEKNGLEYTQSSKRSVGLLQGM